ncbi:dynein beta chain, ciliary-like [Bemisia tabaci]|uniref:dynein beta chain, ciliary-like n=1 Tax=Bemisia tabaci TaxID=7038 RepID=UPI003B28634E
MKVDLNWPPVAGRLQWMIKLKSRMDSCFQKYKEWDCKVVQSEESLNVLKKYDDLLLKLNDLELSTISKWVNEIQDIIRKHMNKSLFATDVQTHLLSINYSAEVSFWLAHSGQF